MKKELKLIQMSNVEVEEIKWVWYHYSPYGKITVVQGDHTARERQHSYLPLLLCSPKENHSPEEENGAEYELLGE